MHITGSHNHWCTFQKPCSLCRCLVYPAYDFYCIYQIWHFFQIYSNQLRHFSGPVITSGLHQTCSVALTEICGRISGQLIDKKIFGRQKFPCIFIKLWLIFLDPLDFVCCPGSSWNIGCSLPDFLRNFCIFLKTFYQLHTPFIRMNLYPLSQNPAIMTNGYRRMHNSTHAYYLDLSITHSGGLQKAGNPPAHMFPPFPGILLHTVPGGLIEGIRYINTFHCMEVFI